MCKNIEIVYAINMNTWLKCQRLKLLLNPKNEPSLMHYLQLL